MFTGRFDRSLRAQVIAELEQSHRLRSHACLVQEHGSASKLRLTQLATEVPELLCHVTPESLKALLATNNTA